jgi:hypothetical protein
VLAQWTTSLGRWYITISPYSTSRPAQQMCPLKSTLFAACSLRLQNIGHTDIWPLLFTCE